MLHARLVLAGFATAALAAGALAPSICAAQDKAGEPAPAPAKPRTERRFDLGGICAPGSVGSPEVSVDSARPFGWRHPESAAENAEVDEPTPSANQVTELVRSLVPTTGAPDDTAVDFDGTSLRVMATAAGHQRVAAIVDALRRSIGAPFEIEVRSIALDGAGADALVAELDALGGGPVADDLARRLLAADRDAGARGSTVTTYEGRWSLFEQVQTRAVVCDWDVEIAQAASIADPVPQAIEDGLRAAVHAARMQDGRTLVSVTAAAGDVVEPFRRVELRTKDLGACELPEVRGAYASTAAPMRVGQWAAIVLAAPLSERDALRRAVLVRLVSAPPAPDLPGMDVAGVGAIRLARARPSFRTPLVLREEDDAVHHGLRVAFLAPRTTLDVAALVRAISASAPDLVERPGNILAAVSDWPGGAVVAQGDKDLRAAVKATLGAAEREWVVGARVGVRLVVRRADGAERVVGSLSSPALVGRGVALAAYASVPYVGDYDVEVAQEARIADPLVRTAFGGMVVNLALAQAEGGGLRVDLELTASSVGAVETSSAGATEVGLLERVTTRRSRVAQTFVLATGSSREVELGPSPWSSPTRGERLVAIVRAEIAR